MMNRVATSSAPMLMLANIQLAGKSLLTAQEQLTTGKRINRVSDDPASALLALGQRATLRRSEQLSRNLDEARSWTDSNDTALSDVNTQLSRARALLVQANSGSADPAARAAIATDLRSIRTALLQTANTTVDGRAIFAGNSAATNAYDASGTYQGDLGAVQVPIASAVSIQVNKTGPDVFGTANPLDPTNGDVFQLLDSLANAVQTGNSTAIGAGLGQIDAATNRVSIAQVDVGGKAKQIDDLGAQLDDSKVSLKTSIGKAEDIDFAEAVINEKTREAAYQAALQATAKVVQPSLLDFLR